LSVVNNAVVFAQEQNKSRPTFIYLLSSCTWFFGCFFIALMVLM